MASVKIEPRPKITILPRLKIEQMPYTKLGIQNANALFFVILNATFVFSLLYHASSIHNHHLLASIRVVSHRRASFHTVAVIWVPQQPLVRPMQPSCQPPSRHHSTPSTTLRFPQTKLLHYLLVSRTTVAPVLESHRRALPHSPCVWWLVEIQKITWFPFFYFTFNIIVFAIWVVVLHFVGVLLVSIFFSYFWLFLVFLRLCSL